MGAIANFAKLNKLQTAAYIADPDSSKLKRRRREVTMAIAVTDEKRIAEILASRERGGYVRYVADASKIDLTSEDCNLWDVTDDFPGKKGNTLKVGLTNALEKSEDFAGKFRVVINDEKVYIVRLAVPVA